MDLESFPNPEMKVDEHRLQDFCLDRLCYVVAIQRSRGTRSPWSDQRRQLIALAMASLYEDCARAGVGYTARLALDLTDE